MSNFSDTGWQPQAGNTTVKEKKSNKGPVVNVSAELLWAELKRRNSMSEKYQVVLSQLSEEAVKELTTKLNIGDRIQHSDERGFFITVKSNYEIPAYDSAGNEIEELISNGSKAKVALGSYAWDFKGKAGWSPSLVRLEVTELIPYTREDEPEDAEVF